MKRLKMFIVGLFAKKVAAPKQMTLVEFQQGAKDVAAKHGLIWPTINCKAATWQFSHRVGEATTIEYSISINVGGVFHQTLSGPTPQSALNHLDSILLALLSQKDEPVDMELAPIAKEESGVENG